MKKVIISVLSMILMLSMFFVNNSVSAASATIVCLTNYYDDYITVSKYDFNGDGKKDVFEALTFTDEYDIIENACIIINDNLVFDNYDCNGGLDAYYIRLKNGKKYILIVTHTDNDITDVVTLYQYTGKKLKVIKKFANVIPTPYSTTPKVSGNTIKLTFGYNSDMAGMIHVCSTYTYKSGKFNGSHKVLYTRKKGVTYLTAGLTLQTYKAAGSKKKAFKIKKNQKVYFKSMIKKNGKIWFKVKVGKKTGYLKEKSYFDDDGIIESFKDALCVA